MVVFHWSQNSPFVSEMFTILVQVSKHESQISFNLSVDIVSNSHPLFFICILTFLTCLVVGGENLANLGTLLYSGSNSGISSNHFWMCSILFKKYDASSLASYLGGLFGSGFSFLLLVNLFTSLKRHLVLLLFSWTWWVMHCFLWYFNNLL